MISMILNFPSADAYTQTEVRIVMPKLPMERHRESHQEGKLKCLYLLHGLSDDASSWSRMTHVEQIASEQGIAVVMPDGKRSFYTNMAYGPKFYDYISQELPAFIEAMFPVSSDPRDRYIAGNSMGGYGALKTSLREKGRFHAAAAFSPVTDIRRVMSEMFTLDAGCIYPDPAHIPDEEDLSFLAETCRERPEIFLGIGDLDPFHKDFLKFSDRLRALDYRFHDTVVPNIGHVWPLWERFLSESLQYFFSVEPTEFLPR